MLNEFSRMESLIGREKTDLLSRKKIAVFGLGGVGSYVTEALARWKKQGAERRLSLKYRRFGLQISPKQWRLRVR